MLASVYLYFMLLSPSMILVTGASGLLGQHVLAELSQRRQIVRAIYRKALPKLYTAIQSERVEWVQADVLDIPSLQDAMEGITQVYHCAAQVSYDKRFHEAMHEVNVDGTANVVNLCLDKPHIKLLHVSSIATLCGGNPEEARSENNRWEESEPHSEYAKSKYHAELEVWRGIAEGLQAVMVNPGIILGEGDRSKSSMNLVEVVQHEFPYYTEGATGWVDAKDVAKAMVLLMESDITAERFVLVSENKSYREVFTLMAQALQVKPPHRLAKPWMTELVWRWEYLKRIFSGQVATITEETARAAHEKRTYNNHKILNTLPSFKFQTLEKTIQRICTS